MKLFGRAVPAPAALTRLPPSQQRWIATGIVVLVAALIAQQGIIRPLRHRRAELDAQFALSQQRIALLRSLETTHHELMENRQRLRSRVESTGLLQEISTMAAANDVVVNSAAPQASKPAGRYSRLPVKLDIAGTYPNILKFLHALETAPKPLLVEQADMGASAVPDWANATSRTLEAHLIVSALLTETS